MAQLLFCQQPCFVQAGRYNEIDDIAWVFPIGKSGRNMYCYGLNAKMAKCGNTFFYQLHPTAFVSLAFLQGLAVCHANAVIGYGNRQVAIQHAKANVQFSFNAAGHYTVQQCVL